MTDNFQLYRGGARKVRNAWSRGWRNDAGGVCLVQSLLDEMHDPGDVLPAKMVNDIDASLQEYRSYRILRAIAEKTGGTRQDGIMAWNDFLGSQQRVAGTLEKIADGKEREYLRAQQLRLQIEVQRLTVVIEELKSDITLLKNRITELETENSYLRRMTTVAARAADRRELAKMERDLEARWNELTAKESKLSSFTTD